jgi:hypothetical protein
MERDLLRLKTEDITLEICPILENEYGWTQVYLETKNEQHFLGADALEDILRKLLEAVSEVKREIAGQIDGENLIHVISLYEKHHSIYATQNIEPTKFYVQNRDAKVIFTFTASSQTKQFWKTEIEAFAKSSK